MGKKNITIIDIAKYANVSIATVSRVINNTDLHKVSQKTYDKITKIIKEKNYIPSQSARTLATQKSQIIGIFLKYNENIFTSEYYLKAVIKLAQRFADIHKDTLISTVSDNKMIISKINSGNLGAAIFIGFGSDLNKHIKNELKIPVITFGQRSKNKYLHVVDSENVIGGFLVTERLIQKGCKKLFFVTGQPTSSNSNDRLKGSKRACKKYNIKFNKKNVFIGHFNYESGYLLTREILKTRRKVDGIFYFNDEMACGGYECLKEQNIKIGQDILVAGYDNIEKSSQIVPSLTTVEQNYDDMYSKTFKIIDNYFKNKVISRQVYFSKPELVVRESA